MRFWSKGLGERELEIDLSKGILTLEEGKVFMRGIIVKPVNWNYEVTLFPEDVRGILRVALSVRGISYFMKNIAGVGTFISRRGELESEVPKVEKEEKKGETVTEQKGA
jgi:hypothetical protein